MLYPGTFIGKDRSLKMEGNRHQNAGVNAKPAIQGSNSKVRKANSPGPAGANVKLLDTPPAFDYNKALDAVLLVMIGSVIASATVMSEMLCHHMFDMASQSWQ